MIWKQIFRFLQHFLVGYESARGLENKAKILLPELMMTAFAKGLGLWLSLVRYPRGEEAVSRWIAAYRDLPERVLTFRKICERA